MAFVEVSGECVAGGCGGLVDVASGELAIHPSAAEGGAHDVTGDVQVLAIGKAGGLVGFANVGAFGGIVGFVVHLGTSRISQTLVPKPDGNI